MRACVWRESQLRADGGHADWTTMTLYDMFQRLVVDQDDEAARHAGGEERRESAAESAARAPWRLIAAKPSLRGGATRGNEC
jgi:hypothetical protein